MQQSIQCARCGRALKDPLSKSAGMGPVCRKKYEAEKEQKENRFADKGGETL